MNCLAPFDLVTFTNKNGEFSEYIPITCKCGHCIPCQLSYSNTWAFRCALESTQHDSCCCLTLTYSDDFLPSGGNLCRRDVQLFFKSLRKKLDPVRIRYFGSAEYGGQGLRPHYHILIFGYDFPDKQIFKKSKTGNDVYVSDFLSKIWYKGYATIGKLDYKACFYAAKYLSKLRSPTDLVSPFSFMSLKPAIGLNGLSERDYSRGFIWFQGQKRWIPRSLYQSLERRGFDFSKIRQDRLDYVKRNQELLKNPDNLIENSWKKSQNFLDILYKM